MSNYHVLPLETEEYDFIWCVMENKSEQLIKAFDFEEDARDYADFLESGGGFDGFTPSFVLQEVAIPGDLNQDFASFLSE